VGAHKFGNRYQNKTAAEKQTILWTEIAADTNSAEFSSEGIVKVLSESMDPTFDAYQDDLEGLDGPLDIFNRSKPIHTVGAVAKMRFVSSGKHPYTGIFKGTTYGLVRLSTPTAYGSSATTSFVPAVALKFLRDGIHSGNVLGINSLQGNPDTFNFFKHDLYSSPLALSSDAGIAEKFIRGKFLEATDWVMIGLSDMSAFDEKGRKENSNSFPFNLVIQGSKEVKAIFNDQFVTDNLPQLVSTIPSGTPLYNLWGEEPNKDPVFIGQVILTTGFTGSDFGDNMLFFQHTRKEEDFSIRTDWVHYAHEAVKQQSSKPYYNGSGDLPDN